MIGKGQGGRGKGQEKTRDDNLLDKRNQGQGPRGKGARELAALPSQGPRCTSV